MDPQWTASELRDTATVQDAVTVDDPAAAWTPIILVTAAGTVALDSLATVQEIKDEQ